MFSTPASGATVPVGANMDPETGGDTGGETGHSGRPRGGTPSPPRGGQPGGPIGGDTPGGPIGGDTLGGPIGGETGGRSLTWETIWSVDAEGAARTVSAPTMLHRMTATDTTATRFTTHLFTQSEQSSPLLDR
jgi:hypothetical protein